VFFVLASLSSLRTFRAFFLATLQAVLIEMCKAPKDSRENPKKLIFRTELSDNPLKRLKSGRRE
jgi:hypothetical protein